MKLALGAGGARAAGRDGEEDLHARVGGRRRVGEAVAFDDAAEAVAADDKVRRRGGAAGKGEARAAVLVRAADVDRLQRGARLQRPRRQRRGEQFLELLAHDRERAVAADRLGAGARHRLAHVELEQLIAADLPAAHAAQRQRCFL